MGSPVYQDFTQRRLVVSYRRLGITFPSCLQWSSRPLRMGPISYPEMSGRNYHYTLRIFLIEKSCPLPDIQYPKPLTYLLTYSMEKSASWEADWFSATQEIPRILWDPKVHYRIHNSPPPLPILSQLDLVHTSTSHFQEIHLNIILPSTPGSPKWSLSLRFAHQNPV